MSQAKSQKIQGKALLKPAAGTRQIRIINFAKSEWEIFTDCVIPF